MGFPGGSVGEEFPCSAGDLVSVPEMGRFPGGGHGNPLQLSCLENPHEQMSLVGYSPWGRKEYIWPQILFNVRHSNSLLTLTG